MYLFRCILKLYLFFVGYLCRKTIGNKVKGKKLKDASHVLYFVERNQLITSIVIPLRRKVNRAIICGVTTETSKQVAIFRTHLPSGELGFFDLQNNLILNLSTYEHGFENFLFLRYGA